MATEPTKMRAGYDYPNRLLFREKMKECGDLKESTAKNFETAIVNSSGVYFVKAQALWTRLMPSVPLPPIIVKTPPQKPPIQVPLKGTLFEAPPLKDVKPTRKHNLTEKMLKGWVNKVFTEAETLEFLSDLWHQKEIS